MFIYQKKLQYPVNIKNTNPKLAQIIISQYGGPDGNVRRFGTLVIYLWAKTILLFVIGI